MNKRSFLDSILSIDQKWIFIVTLIVLAVPLLFPLGLPLTVNNNARDLYTMVDGLPQGSVVVYIWGADSMTWMEQGLPATAVLKHLMMKPGIKILAFSEMEQGPLYWQMATQQMGTYGKKYGQDFVYLGYLPGDETMFATVAADVWKACGSKDYYGNDLGTLPMMANIHSAKDIDVIIHLSMGDTMLYALRQWQMPYKKPLYVIPLGAVQATLVPYRRTGQISGWIAGAREAAEYELLLKSPGLALAQMDAQSIGHFYVIGLILLCNVGYLMTRNKERRN
jgi:hypothetical protein